MLYLPTILPFRNSYVQPTPCANVFYVDLWPQSDYFPIQHQLIGFYNRDGECLLLGTEWIITSISGVPPLKGPYKHDMMIKPKYEECLSKYYSSTVPTMPVNHSVPSEQTKALCVLSSSHSQAHRQYLTHNKALCQVYVGTLKNFVQQKRQMSWCRCRHTPNSKRQQSTPLLSHFSAIQSHRHLKPHP